MNMRQVKAFRDEKHRREDLINNMARRRKNGLSYVIDLSELHG